MTRIAFYVLTGSGGRHAFACRLVQKAFQQRARVFIHCDDSQLAREVDEVLWTFDDTAFLPHALQDDPLAPQAAVLIGDRDPGESHSDILINLSPGVPEFFARFERVLEVLDDQPEVKADGRVRYRHYRERGYPLEVHEMKGKA
jgi:DNA polymerase III subunit chi